MYGLPFSAAFHVAKPQVTTIVIGIILGILNET